MKQKPNNHKLLREFIIDSPKHDLKTFGDKLRKKVHRRTIWRWCKTDKPSGPDGYQHRLQIEKITGGVVKASAWD